MIHGMPGNPINSQQEIHGTVVNPVNSQQAVNEMTIIPVIRCFIGRESRLRKSRCMAHWRAQGISAVEMANTSR
jgi:hypothetical protein